MGMMDIVKQAGLGAVNSTNPVNVVFGEVVSVEDLKIRLDQKLVLPKEFFIIPHSLIRYEIDLSNLSSSTNSSLNKLVIREGLKKGDKVLLLRVQGGQKYVILDKVV